jgi:hypothetical protein
MSSHRLFQQPAAEGEYRFWQQAWVVTDLIAAAQRWVEVYGIGPFHVLPPQKLKAHHRGGETEFEMQLAIAQAGPVQIELIQQRDERPSIYRDFFAAGQSGPHHLCTLSYDYDRSLSHYRSLDYPVAMELSSPAGRVSYIDTTADFGLVTEVVEASEVFVRQLEAIARTCAQWDGVTDPVRLLRRGGYTTPDGREVTR